MRRLFGMSAQNTSPMRVLVTGGPRSGTSFLSGLIGLMGFSHGKPDQIKEADEHNQFGYFEHEELTSISKTILKKLDADFHHKLPHLETGWMTSFENEKNLIRKIVRRDQVELYKGNRLLVLGDLYGSLFPDAKWVYISRPIEETYKSRFGQPMTYDAWEEVTRLRIAAWERTQVSKQALHLEYNTFKEAPEANLNLVEQHLGVQCSEEQRQKCLDFFRPSGK